MATSLAKEIEEQARVSVFSELTPVLQEKVQNKAKLTIEEQIEYLEAKGIVFSIMEQSAAKQYLVENSYYYKVTAYRLNFSKNDKGLYYNLDFAHLTDLATIDMHLRYLVLKLALDIEHSLKSTLVNFITEDSKEDGYEIIEEFNNFKKEKVKKYNNNVLPDDYIHIKDKIIKEVRRPRDYNYDFYIKAQEKTSIWKLIEMMSLGQLIEFIDFYVSNKRHKSTRLKIANQFLGYAKNVRDSAAHSRPLLLNVTEINQLQGSNRSHKTNQPQAEIELKDYVKKNGLDKRLVSRRLTNFKIIDLSSLIFLHDSYITSKYMRKSRKQEMFKVYKRALYRRKNYTNIEEFDEVLDLFYGIIKKYKAK